MNEESLFAAALERATAAEREAFLDEACAGDVALRERVDRLLAADEKPAASSTSRPGRRDRRKTLPGWLPTVSFRANASALWWPAATSCSRRSAKAAWAPSGWPSRRTRCAARSR